MNYFLYLCLFLSLIGCSKEEKVNDSNHAPVIYYSPIYSNYGVCSKSLPCEGEGFQTREIVACQKIVDGNPISEGQLSDCFAYNNPLDLTRSCLSPAGTSLYSINNGIKTVSCVAGSTEQNFISISCDYNFHSNGQNCEENEVITYYPYYSNYGVCSSVNACDGTGIQTRELVFCQKIINGINVSGGSVSDCSEYNTYPYLVRTCASSLSHFFDLNIEGGTISYSCNSGVPISSSLSCQNGYNTNPQILICEDNNSKTLYRVGEHIDGPNNVVKDLAVQPDGKILIDSNGSIDITFNSGQDPLNISGVEGTVSKILIQSDDKILIAGKFTKYNGIISNNLARLNSNGSLDQTFNSTGMSDGEVFDLKVLENHSIIIGGSFSKHNGINSYRLAKILPNGEVDYTFNITPWSIDNFYVKSLIISKENNIIISGFFESGFVDSRSFILKYSENGVLSKTFPESFRVMGVSQYTSYLPKIIHNKKGDILIGGSFLVEQKVPKNNYFIRLTEEGRFDYSHNYIHRGLSMSPTQILKQSDGKLVVTGGFHYYQNKAVNNIIRLNQDGSFDPSFNVQNHSFFAIYTGDIQPDNKIIIGVLYFDESKGAYISYISRLNQDGTVDSNFLNNNLGFFQFHSIKYIKSLPDGKILVLGTSVRNQTNIYYDILIRLNSDGSVDPSFPLLKSSNSSIYSMDVQSDGKILIGGRNSPDSILLSNGLIRLHPDGSVDSSFNLAIPSYVIFNIKVISNEKILIQGIDIQNSKYKLYRINFDGSIDESFQSSETYSLLNRC